MINKWLKRIDNSDPQRLFGFIVAASILLAAWMQYIQHGWINPDSVLYLEQARLFAIGDWKGIVAVFEWPLYGICIGFIHKATSLSIHVSAQFLNMLFFGIATASFLKLINLAGGKNRTLALGALLLFSSQYIVGDVLEMLMRDEGFWAFFLTGLVFLIHYNQSGNLRDALLWQVSMIIATLFRIEAILYLLLLPLFFICCSQTGNSSKIRKVINAYSISILIVITIGLIVTTHPELSMQNFGRLKEVFTTNLYQEFTQQLFTRADIMSTQVLGSFLDEFAIPGLLLTFLYIIVSKAISTTGLIGTTLAALHLKNTKPPSNSMHPEVRRILLVTGAIALVSTALIITKVFVLSGRYMIAFAWILLIFAALHLEQLSTNLSKKHRVIFLIICLILCLGLIKNILPKRSGYNYQQEAVSWLQSNKNHNSSVFYDDPRMRYYAKAPFTRKWNDGWALIQSKIDDRSINNYDYLLVSYSKKRPEQEQTVLHALPNFTEVNRFNGRKAKKYIVIYKKTAL